jgi:hypothetical protein
MSISGILSLGPEHPVLIIMIAYPVRKCRPVFFDRTGIFVSCYSAAFSNALCLECITANTMQAA